MSEEQGLLNRVFDPTTRSLRVSGLDGTYAAVNAVPPMKPKIGDYVTFPHSARINNTLTADRMFCVPFWLTETMTFDRIAADLAVAAGTTGVLRLGVYGWSAYRPGALSLDAGTVSGAGSTGLLTITIDLTLTPGIYFLTAAAQGADAALPTWRTASAVPMSLPTTDPSGASNLAAYFRTSVSGALPTPAGVTAETTGPPLVHLRRSA